MRLDYATTPRIRRLAKAALAGALALVLMAAAVGSARQVSVLKAKNADEILHVVSRLRGLDVKRAVKSGSKSHDEIEQSVIADLNENTTPAEFAATAKTLTKLGLIDKGFALREYVIKLLREQVAGFYDTKTQTFYLASWIPFAEQEPVIAHELTHALQDQHFDLRRFEKWPKGDSDAELAVHALIEGEATVLMFEYTVGGGKPIDLSRIGSLTDLLLSQSDAGDATRFPVMAGAPAVLRENLQFPYVYGVGFVQGVIKEKSWKSLDSCYEDLPQSTEQIIHPDRYLARDKPIKIEIPDLGPALGSRWKRADYDVNGEFGYTVLLSQFVEKQRAKRAAAGWGGDRYALYEDAQAGRLLLTQFTSWDTIKDAEEFFEAYKERTAKRYHIAAPSAESGHKIMIDTEEGAVLIELRGQDVVAIEGAENRDQLSKLAALVWQASKKP